MMVEIMLQLIAYLLAGLTLKLGDDLLDELDLPSLAWYPLGIAGVLFGILMAINEWNLVLLTAIVVGVLLSGKVNRKQFSVGFALIALILLVFGIPAVTDLLGWLSMLFMLFMASVLDEKGNDWVENAANPKTALFFKYRFTLKITALLLVIPWVGFLVAAIGIWVFDMGYELVGWLIRRSLQTGP
jgi:hypothetical protein